MYERFSDRVRVIVALANDEAHRFNHPQVSPEHVLLALILHGTGVGYDCQEAIAVDPHKLRLELEKRMQICADPLERGRRPPATRTKRLVELALEQARVDGRAYLGTEHLLLGMLRMSDGAVGEALSLLGVSEDEVRAALPPILAGAGNRIAQRSSSRGPGLPNRLGRLLRSFWTN